MKATAYKKSTNIILVYLGRVALITSRISFPLIARFNSNLILTKISTQADIGVCRLSG